jgi:heptosyltransferase-2
MNCKYFAGDRPCEYHKQYGMHCTECRHYSQVSFRILIIKLDAIGDVLRTTAILQGLKEKYEKSHITWITQGDSVPLFKNNPYVDAVLEYNIEAILTLMLEKYDLVINLDASPRSAKIAESARGTVKVGFGYDEKGYVRPYNNEAIEWFVMGLFDDVKKANKRTYQDIIMSICGLNPTKRDVILNLTEEEIEFGNKFAQSAGITKNKLVVGLNTGAGARWGKKQWTKEGYWELIQKLDADRSTTILLFGGPAEAERNAYLAERAGNRVINTGNNNSLRHFAALLNLCDIIVTGDTLGLHIAVALNKKIVALFGPTSIHEIDLYERGVKISSELDCTCCYKMNCDKKPDCMESISVDSVYNAIMSLVEKRRTK